jgi:hypothetical protein
VTFGAPTFRRACTVREMASKVRCGSLPALLRKWGGYRTPGASRDAHGKRGPTQRHGLIHEMALTSRRARIGRSRSCSRVVECCRSRQTVAGAEKRTLSISPDLDSVQGRAPSLKLHVRKYEALSEETLAPSSRRNLHVTVFESGCEPAHGAGRWRWKASRIVVAGGSSRNACMSRSRLARRTIEPRESEVRATRKRQGCQRYGGSGRARKKTPRRNPERPAEADRAS